MNHLKQVLPAFIALLVSVCRPVAAAQIERGTIEGAHFAIAFPDEAPWNRQLLMIAHGFRPESAPLVADLFPDQAAYAALIDEGWMIAKTSYRRNGVIIADAIKDLDNLHRHIAENHAPPHRVILEGDSMGGTIVTHLMERDDPRYDGAVAIGAALDLRENNGAQGVSLAPLRPLLFMSNRSEIAGPRSYAAHASVPVDQPNLVPVVFRIDRDGHVNVNQAERLVAIRALNSWLDRGRKSLPQDNPWDATQVPQPGPSPVTFDDDGRGLTTAVTHISAIYGNVWIDLQPAHLEQINLTPGLWFQLTVNGNQYRTRFGKDFSSVERGQWVIFPNADGFFWLSRNWGNAAETAGIQLGDQVTIRRYPSSD